MTTLSAVQKEKYTSRERLLSAALEIFNKQGVNEASIHDICKQAAVSIGSAYHHFGSKQGLADALYTEGLRDNRQASIASFSPTDTAERRTRALVQSLINWIEAHPAWAQYIYSAGMSHLVESPGTDDVKTENREFFSEYFVPYIAMGEIRELPAELYGSVVLGPVHDYAKRSLAGTVQGSLSDHAETFCDLAWEAVRPRNHAQ